MRIGFLAVLITMSLFTGCDDTIGTADVQWAAAENGFTQDGDGLVTMKGELRNVGTATALNTVAVFRFFNGNTVLKNYLYNAGVLEPNETHEIAFETTVSGTVTRFATEISWE